jgi:hypothetical protein
MRPSDPPGRYTVSIAVDATGGGFDADIPVEIGVQLVKPGQTLGMTRDAGQLATPTPSPTASARPRATAAAPAPKDSDALTGWLVVLGLGVAGIVVGLAAAAVLSRRATV